MVLLLKFSLSDGGGVGYERGCWIKLVLEGVELFDELIERQIGRVKLRRICTYFFPYCTWR